MRCRCRHGQHPTRPIADNMLPIPTTGNRMTTSNDARHTIVGSLFALAIVILTALVIQRFFLPLAWAAVFCIATWPLYLRLELALGKRPVIAAALMTLAMACLLVIPFLVGVDQASRQASTLAEWIAVANNQGIAAPAALRRIPFAGN